MVYLATSCVHDNYRSRNITRPYHPLFIFSVNTNDHTIILFWFARPSTNGVVNVLTFRHWSFTFNSNKSPTWCNNFSVYYPDVFYNSTCLGRFPAHHQELNDCSSSLWIYFLIVVADVLCSWSGRPAWPRTQHVCHDDKKVNPEAATAVIELLMMGGKTP